MIGMFLVHLFLLHIHHPETSVAVGSFRVVEVCAKVGPGLNDSKFRISHCGFRWVMCILREAAGNAIKSRSLRAPAYATSCPASPHLQVGIPYVTLDHKPKCLPSRLSHARKSLQTSIRDTLCLVEVNLELLEKA